MMQKLEEIKTKYNEVLTADEIRKTAPSVFGTAAHTKRSKDYRFVATSTVLEALINEGFYPVLASQKRSRVDERRTTTRHMLRLRHHSFLENMKDEIPELVLLNSHDGSSAYQLMAGIFRMVCSNGLVVASSTFGTITARHAGSDKLVNNIIDAGYQIVEEVPRIMDQIDRFKSVKLNSTEQLAYAVEAVELRPTKIKIENGALLEALREDDERESDGKRNLWKTYNVVQEKLIAGGNRIGLNRNGRMSNLRALGNLQQSINTNKALWQLTEKYACRA